MTDPIVICNCIQCPILTQYQTTQMISLDYASTFELGPFSANKYAVVAAFPPSNTMSSLKEDDSRYMAFWHTGSPSHITNFTLASDFRTADSPRRLYHCTFIATSPCFKVILPDPKLYNVSPDVLWYQLLPLQSESEQTSARPTQTGSIASVSDQNMTQSRCWTANAMLRCSASTPKLNVAVSR
jgi:hypothetical protein